MEIIPAIDIIDGRCVRLVQGRFDQETVFSDNPVEMAVKWADQGAKRLHVVDLDGARMGKTHNLKVLEKIVKSINIPVQTGGGIRTLETAKTVLATGVSRVIIGTSAALDNTKAEEIFGELGENAILGVDALNGYVAVRGWLARTEEKAVDFAKRMMALGVKRIIFTDISRDGMLTGVNVHAMERMLKAVDVPVIASGGVSSLQDIKRLAPLTKKGLEGAIVGKSLYTGDLTLPEVIAEAEKAKKAEA